MPRAQNWLLQIQEPDGSTVRATYSWTDASVNLHLVGGGSTSVTPTARGDFDKFEAIVTPDEDSVRLTFTAGRQDGYPDIHARDVVTLYTLGYRTFGGEDGDSDEIVGRYYPRWRGVAIVVPNQNDDLGQQSNFECVGLSRVLDRTPLGDVIAPAGEDIASSVADAILTEAGVMFPYGITYNAFASIGVTSTAKVIPNGTDLKQMMNKLVAICNTDGGVEAVWGVDRFGRLFFKEKTAATENLGEGNEMHEVLVDWEPIQADDVVSSVRFMIAEGTLDRKLWDAESIDTDVPDVLYVDAPSGSSPFGAQTLITQVSPDEALRDLGSDLNIFPVLTSGTIEASYSGTTADAAVVINNAGGYSVGATSMTVDSLTDPLTSGHVLVFTGGGHFKLSASANAGATSITGTLSEAAVADNETGFILTRAFNGVTSDYIVVSGTEAGGTAVMMYEHTNLDGRLVGWSAEFAENTTVATDMGATVLTSQGATTQTHLLRGRRVGNAAVANDDGYPNTRVFSVGGVRAAGPFTQNLVNTEQVRLSISAGSPSTVEHGISDFRIWEVNSDDLVARAKELYATPETNAATIRYRKELAPVAFVNLTDKDGDSHPNLEVREVRYEISGSAGVRTVLQVGEPTPPGLTQEANAIKDRDRNSVRASGVRRVR